MVCKRRTRPFVDGPPVFKMFNASTQTGSPQRAALCDGPACGATPSNGIGPDMAHSMITALQFDGG